MSENKYDLVVIGSGPGGYVASIVAAQKGMKVASIEKRESLGGTCLNVGCIPSKAMLHASEQYENTVKLNGNEDWGIECKEVTLDLDKLLKKKSGIVEELTKGIDYLFRKNKVTKYLGTAKIISSQEIQINNNGKIQSIHSDKIIIATGSSATVLPNIVIDEKHIVTSTGALELKKVPKKLVVIGAGVIGLEMGTVWRRLGSEVEVIEFLPRILPGMDNEIADKFMKILKKQGLKFQLGHSLEAVKKVHGKVILSLKDIEADTLKELDADVVLIAVGRKPNTKDLGIEELNLVTDKHGFIEINSKFETSVPNIYAIGDVVKGPMLAHKAEEDGVAAVEIINGEAGHVDYNLVPGIIYTSPEVAVIGKTEEELKNEGTSYNKGVFPLTANSRAKAIGHTDGMVKILADKSTDKILGAHMIGHEAGTVIHELSIAMGFGASSEDVARICHGHPTVNEAVKEAALATYSKAIHS
ncbi:dihydrolipoyl dehydrogenase [Alphaproteobacteria bacterium]|nr:dihydrolipoyl dehydrogenase [Alphaproteobacteria bacterium]MDC1023203.1 dihydrolipoyl dehydrogenase [Alphaproteobacteria bacterium]